MRYVGQDRIGRPCVEEQAKLGEENYSQANAGKGTYKTARKNGTANSVLNAGNQEITARAIGDAACRPPNRRAMWLVRPATTVMVPKDDIRRRPVLRRGGTRCT